MFLWYGPRQILYCNSPLFMRRWSHTWRLFFDYLLFISHTFSALERQYFMIAAFPGYLHSITKTNLFKYIKKIITKKWKFLDKKSDICHISAQNIDCGYSLEPPRRGGSNEYPQSMFLSRDKNNNVYPCKPQFYHIKMGFKAVNII